MVQTFLMTPASVRRPPAWRLYVYVLAPSVVVVSLAGALAITTIMLLGAVRAYVGGESLWSKARNEAVQHLRDYASSHDPADYALFEQALRVPLGDRRAREGMSNHSTDTQAIRQAFREGGNHPDDIDGMITLFRHFGSRDLFKDSLAAWEEGDELIAQLQSRGQALRTAVLQGSPPADLRAILQDIRDINTALFQAEIRFSANLARASRVTENLLTGSTLLAMAALSLTGYLIMRQGLMRQQRYQQALSRANRKLELAVLGARMGLFELSADGSVVTLDAHAAALYGLEERAITLPGRALMERVVPEDRGLAEQAVKAALAGEDLFRLTLRVMVPGQSQARYLETIGSLPDHGADPALRLIGVVRDVTQAHHQQQLHIERDAAEKVAQSQRQFLSRLSHELRTPLNAILGFAQLLSMDRQHTLPPPQQKQVEWILDAGQQLLKLVEDVLDLSKVEAGEIGIHPSPTELSGIVHASLVLVEAALQRYEVTVVNRIPAQRFHVLADSARLQQVLVNLLSNGCKYNRPGGHITLDANEEADHISLVIADNGVGLTPKDTAELFHPFSRVQAMSAKVEGTGLGLYIVKQLVERMGGSVTVSSELNVGSRFTVRLPKAPPAPSVAV
ncbi:MAG TPA: ATP-binding protein [Aquabacterium sp.]|uniref:PAS domain-containing sensor histidine kinase n=1 Tax=Aquabacterium sp. TaxID=1872578 RepID=UPI002E3190E1|nr:ATP-binding protein [Aquabacterium sp.]HEX5356327.1 ATP-binding protein [Aquabacterium sp.]